MQDESSRRMAGLTSGQCPRWVTFDRFSRCCLPVHVRFGSKVTDWPVVGHLTLLMSTRPSKTPRMPIKRAKFHLSSIEHGARQSLIHHLNKFAL